MSLSEERLAKLREEFYDIDWPAAYEAQGKELERIRAAIDVRAAEIVKDILIEEENRWLY